MNSKMQNLPGIRSEAILSNASRYFTGKPCKHGHLAPRRTANGGCMECGERRSPEALIRREKNRTTWKTETGKRVQYNRTTYVRNRAAVLARTRENHLRRTYGITSEIYASLMALQGGVCDICKKVPSSGRRLSVDHCHDTGVVRGLLCPSCNAWVEKYQKYLSKEPHNIEYIRASEETNG